ncbi:MAG: hypothetical protein HRU17_03055 [Polyangiaceae bacterium]|nr:hypothetical protein [Polyangiaceae bacterium]
MKMRFSKWSVGSLALTCAMACRNNSENATGQIVGSGPSPIGADGGTGTSGTAGGGSTATGGTLTESGGATGATGGVPNSAGGSGTSGTAGGVGAAGNAGSGGIPPDVTTRLAFLVDNINLRDPLVMVSIPLLGCLESTDLVNDVFNDAFSDDFNPADGKFDTSFLLDPEGADLTAASYPGALLTGSCEAIPAGTNVWEFPPAYCESVPPSTPLVFNTVTTNELCLGTVPGTSNYTVDAVNGPCVVTEPAAVVLTISGIELVLAQAQFAGTIVDGATNKELQGGLIRGFITEDSAINTILPDREPIPAPVRGEPLWELLKGGGGCVSGAPDSDLDELEDGTPGWWFYINFHASEVGLIEQ